VLGQMFRQDDLPACTLRKHALLADGERGAIIGGDDIRQRELCGKLPQTFVHGLLLACAARLAVPWGW